MGEWERWRVLMQGGWRREARSKVSDYDHNCLIIKPSPPNHTSHRHVDTAKPSRRKCVHRTQAHIQYTHSHTHTRFAMLSHANLIKVMNHDSRMTNDINYNS